MAKITIYTRKGNDGYLPTVNTDNQEEAKNIVKLYITAGFTPCSHLIHEDGREEWFISD